MAVIDFSGDRAAALKAKAAARGLTLEAWLQKLATVESPVRHRKNRYNLSELITQCDPSAALSAEDSAWLNVPTVGREA